MCVEQDGMVVGACHRKSAGTMAVVYGGSVGSYDGFVENHCETSQLADVIPHWVGPGGALFPLYLQSMTHCL